jgi:hypothetical protein
MGNFFSGSLFQNLTIMNVMTVVLVNL